MTIIILHLKKIKNVVANDDTSEVFSVIKYGSQRYETPIYKAVKIFNIDLQYEFDIGPNYVGTIIVLNWYKKNIVGRTHIGEVRINVEEHIDININYATAHPYRLINNDFNSEIEIKIGAKHKSKKNDNVQYDKMSYDDIIKNTKEIQCETNIIAKNILNIAEQSLDIGNNITDRLDKDERIIDRLRCDIDAMQNNIVRGSRSVRSINSFWGTLANKISSPLYKESKMKSKLDKKYLKEEFAQDKLRQKKEMEQWEQEGINKIKNAKINSSNSTLHNYGLSDNLDPSEINSSITNDTDQIIDQVDNLLDDLIVVARNIGEKISINNKKLENVKYEFNDVNAKIVKLTNQTRGLIN